MSPSIFAIAKFLHVIASVILVGLSVAVFFYLMQSQKHKKLLPYALRVSFYVDALYIILIGVIMVTAITLQHALHLSSQVAWIKVAHIGFGLVIILWLIQMSLRIASYRQKKLIYRNVYIIIAIIIWILFVLIIRDASTHSTWITLVSSR